MILLFLFVFFVTVELFYYLFFFARLHFLKNEFLSDNQPPISVIICAKNESENLLNNLPLFFNQKYPEFEIVIVDDCSVDDTYDILKAYEANHANLKIVTLRESERFEGGKKFALTMGIKASKHEFLLFTDADCTPKSENWIAEFAKRFTENKEIVLGYSGYQKTKGFLNKLIRFDAFFIGLQYLSYALAKTPYMGVGRNMAYTKTLFFKNKGFSKHQHIVSGDDDLFVNQTANSHNTVIVTSTDSQTISPAKTTFLSWNNQKKRHLTTGKFYKLKHTLLLSAFFFSKLGVLVFFAINLSLLNLTEIVGAIFVFRMIIQLLIFYKPMKMLGESDLLPFSPLFDVILLFIYPFFVVSNIIFKPAKWKRNLN